MTQKNKKYVVGWFCIGGGSGTLPKVYDKKQDGYDFAVEMNKHKTDSAMRYFVREVKK